MGKAEPFPVAPTARRNLGQNTDGTAVELGSVAGRYGRGSAARRPARLADRQRCGCLRERHLTIRGYTVRDETLRADTDPRPVFGSAFKPRFGAGPDRQTIGAGAGRTTGTARP